MAKPRYRMNNVGQVSLVGDGMQNVVTGLGGPSDKGSSNRHTLEIPSDYELTVAYEMSWVAGQIVDIPVEDATKKWRTWHGDKAEEIAEIERSLLVQQKVTRAAKSGRLYGGALLVVGAGSENADEPLDFGSVTEIRYLNVIDRFDIAPGPIVDDVTLPRFGRPEYYTANIGGALRRVHPSRVCEFGGRPPASRWASIAMAGWDNSVLTCKMDAIRDVDAAMAHVRSLIAEAKIDAIKTPNLTQRVMDPREEAALVKQLQLVQQTVGNRRKMLLDKEEDLVSSVFSFGGVAEMVDRFMQMAAGAADIPVTRLFGKSPGGLDSTGDGDLSNYYDNIVSIQSNQFAPTLRPLDTALKAAVGALDDLDTKPVWRPVRELSEKDLAEVQERTVNAVTRLMESQVFLEDELVPMAVEAMSRVGLTGIEVTSAEN